MRAHGSSSTLTAVSLLPAAILFVLACTTQRAPEPPGGAAPSFDECIRRGSADLSRGDSEAAIAEFSKAATLKESPRAYNFLGMAFFQKRDYSKAEENFRHALALDASFASALANLGGVYFMRNEYARAKETLAATLAVNPDLVAANYSMGSVLIALGDLEGGASYLSRGIALDPEYLDTHSTLVASASSASFGRPEICFLYAKLFAATGNVEKTVEYLSRAKRAGFREWHRIAEEKAFEKVRDDPRVRDLSRT